MYLQSYPQRRNFGIEQQFQYVPTKHFQPLRRRGAGQTSDTSEDHRNEPEIEIQSDREEFSDVTRSTASIANARRVMNDGFHANGLLSNASKGSRSFHSRISPLDDYTFLPPPSRPHGLVDPSAGIGSPLPFFDLITHSGRIMVRTTLADLVRRKWREMFWIAYGKTRLLFFAMEQDFVEWISNPYLSHRNREKLVKLSLDFVKDLFKPEVLGYQITKHCAKKYRNGLNYAIYYQFKLEKWFTYGPVIFSAFASRLEHNITDFQDLMDEMMKMSPANAVFTRNLTRHASKSNITSGSNDTQNNMLDDHISRNRAGGFVYTCEISC
mmetsp:Transcript_15414/g.21997  ORF Transcript_15414/g.21997 Transcript_15414/m.21997 type:complete len:325 (-) Transcript_15414:220-1194(-)|eukprot:CAMPEP_0184868856 /NCGR_PEP_ID=MMETSP0580-20130426/31970_1 /TAXON_ID=1118495 /ORGANISM="Dactyliosolen fragilissimus" /LENGTH=324 /DNA_ID=CAMNT_0027370003 /DNA_START=76 /DNA_END=1050 /DNA_ORIENTATION=+